jgi:hypothetical protein
MEAHRCLDPRGSVEPVHRCDRMGIALGSLFWQPNRFISAECESRPRGNSAMEPLQ